MIVSRRTGREPHTRTFGDALTATSLKNVSTPPSRRKISCNYPRVQVTHGSASAQGQRKTMEDAQVSKLNLNLKKTACVQSTSTHRVQFHAVFDGHGDNQAAEWLARHLIPIVEQYLSSERVVEIAITKAFERADKILLEEKFNSGSTCVAMLIEECTNTAWAINVGDSRCVLNSGFATKDHKPTCPREAARIDLAGGWVTNNRVSGLLAVSRAFGDRHFKPIVSAVPEITKIKLKDTDKFAILACDGLWDVLSNELACSLASDGFRIGAQIEDICWGLVTAAIKERKSSDNVSVTLLKFS